MKWVNTTEIGHFVISIVRNDSEMTEMTESVKFGMNQTFWYLKSWISDTKRSIVTKVEKPALFGELANNVTFLFDVATTGFQMKQGFFYGEYWNK